MVVAEHLSKRFVQGKAEKVAVADVSFEARPGKVFGLLGVNGAGKTTTLRILSTVIRASTGTATIQGFDVVKQAADVRRNIGFLSTSTALYGRLTGAETLRYFGQLYGLAGDRLQDRIRYVTEKLQLQEFQDRMCDKLSTGQKQRISIARAILHDPPVLFFDEPTAGLDVVTSQTVMEFIEECRNRGKTVIFSTHIMSEAARLCDEIAVIHDGVICGRGSTASLLSQTATTDLEQAFLRLVGYRREVSLA